MLVEAVGLPSQRTKIANLIHARLLRDGYMSVSKPPPNPAMTLCGASQFFLHRGERASITATKEIPFGDHSILRDKKFQQDTTTDSRVKAAYLASLFRG